MWRATLRTWRSKWMLRRRFEQICAVPVPQHVPAKDEARGRVRAGRWQVAGGDGDPHQILPFVMPKMATRGPTTTDRNSTMATREGVKRIAWLRMPFLS